MAKSKGENNVEEIETGKMKNRVYVKSKELIKPNNKREDKEKIGLHLLIINKDYNKDLILMFISCINSRI